LTKEQIIFWTVRLAWLLASIVLIITFKVHRPRSLANAPGRESSLTLALAGGIFLLYIVAQIMVFTFITHLCPPQGEPGKMLNTSATMAITGTALVCCTLLIMRQTMVGGEAGGLKKWGISLTSLPKGITLGILGWFIIIPWMLLISDLIARLLKSYGLELTTHSTLIALREPMPLPTKIIIILTAAIAAPIVEELLFRGVIQTALIQRFFGLSLGATGLRSSQTRAAPNTASPPSTPIILDYESVPLTPSRHSPSPAQRWIAILLTSFLFAAIHGMIDQFLVLFTLSLALGYIYERTGNLWAPISLHATFNTITLTAWLLSPPHVTQ